MQKRQINSGDEAQQWDDEAVAQGAAGLGADSAKGEIRHTREFNTE